MSAKPKTKKTKPKDELNPKPANFDCELDEGSCQVENNGKIYDFRMDARGFDPSDIKLKITKTHVKIEAIHETEEEISEITEEIELPEGIEHKAIEITINKNGVLRIYGPLANQPVAEVKTKIVREEKRTERVMVTKEAGEVHEEIIEIMFYDVDPPKLDKKFVDASKDLVKSESGDHFKLNLDLPGFAKEDIKVNVYKTIATVEAKKPSTEPGKLQVEICKKIELPKQTRRKTLTSVMNIENGRFCFTGLLKTPGPPKPQPKEDKVFEIKKIPAEKKPITEDVPLETIVDPKGGLTKEEALKVEDVSEKIGSTFDNGKFQAEMDVKPYGPDDLEIKALKSVVTVRGKQFGSNNELFKMFKLPPRIKQENIKSTFTSKSTIKFSSTLEEMYTVTTKVLASDPAAPPPVTQVKAENFKQVLDISGYKPEEIDISIKNGWITVKGKQVSGVYDFGHDFRSRQFSRKFTIPIGCTAEQINCQVDPASNTLHITVKK